MRPWNRIQCRAMFVYTQWCNLLNYQDDISEPLQMIQCLISDTWINITFAPQANRMRISSNGCIKMIASAKALCKGFATHSVGMLRSRAILKLYNEYINFTRISQDFLQNSKFMMNWMNTSIHFDLISLQ